MKKAFTPTFRFSDIQKKTLKDFAIGLLFLTFSLLSEEAVAQVSRTVFNDFNNNATKDATSALTEENPVMIVKTPLNSGVFTSDKSFINPVQNNDATHLTESYALALGVDNSGLSEESKHGCDIGLTQALKFLYPNYLKVTLIKN